MKKPLIIITGASSGIGSIYAKLLAAEPPPRHFILIARRVERLNALRSEITQNFTQHEVSVIPGDLCDPLFLQSLPKQILSFNSPIELLINNAGFGSVGRFAERDISRELAMVSLNCQAVLSLTHALIPTLIKEPQAGIINVCSTASFQPMTFMATYGATKAFLLHWSLALAAELKPHGVRVLAQCPGPTQSEFHLASGLNEKMSHLPAMTAEQVVEEGLCALRRGRSLVIHGRLNTFLAGLNRIFTKSFSADIVRRILQANANKVDRAP